MFYKSKTPPLDSSS